MKTTLRTKLLQHFAKKKHNNEGFTLIELLVVIIIVGILSAIALPSFLNQANKARESGAKTNLGAINRAQQAYRVENGQFATDADFGGDFGIARPETDDYTFAITDGGEVTKATAATTKKTDAASGLDNYTGCVETDGQQDVVPSDEDCLPAPAT